MVAIVGQLFGGWQAEKLAELALHGVWDWVKEQLMKGKASSAVGSYWPIIPNPSSTV
jgi:hypothetical protein